MNGVVGAQSDQHQAGGGESEAGDDQGDPGPSPADDSPGERREEHGHRGHRQRVDPGLQRGESTHVLEVEGVEEEEPTERGEGSDGDDGGGREGHGPEEAQVDERLAGPVLPDQERDQRHGGHGEGSR